MITSSHTDYPTDVEIGRWQGAGLDTASKVRFKLFTLDNGLIVRKIGALQH